MLIRLAREIFLFALISFALHFMWESAHVPLYTGYKGLSGDIPMSLWASIGDVLYALAAVALLTIGKGRADWLSEARIIDFCVLAVFGFLIALGVEYKAFVLGRWAYTSAMPVIPYLHVGLSPILQMTILLPFAVYLTKLTSSRLR